VVAARPHGTTPCETGASSSHGQTGTVRVVEIANGSIGGQAMSLAIRVPRVLARAFDQLTGCLVWRVESELAFVSDMWNRLG
jgi:hypothetical protein